MQTEKSQPLCQRIMPETRLTSFTALSVYPRIGISLSAAESAGRFFFFLSNVWGQVSLKKFNTLRVGRKMFMIHETDLVSPSN